LSIDYSRIFPGEPVGPSWELDHTEADAEGCISCNRRRKYHLDSQLP
jgi:hypothetical protein